MNLQERLIDIEKLRKYPNYNLLWCRHGDWLVEQAKKAEEYKDALDNITNELGRGYPL